jgi:hypothetical protein
LIKDEDFGGQIKKGGLVKDKVNSINAKASLPFDKMLLAYDDIKNTMKWNGLEWKYPTTSLRKALNEKIGNCADINLALILLLKELGLNADPVVLSTRENGLLSPDHPVLTKLNYVLVHVQIDSTEYLLDATDVNRPYNMLPYNCLNGQGWLVTESNPHWIDLLTKEKVTHLYYAEMSISAKGEVAGKLIVSESGYAGVQKRSDYMKLGSESFTKNIKEKKKNWEVTDIQFENINDISKPLKIIHEMKSTEVAQVSGQMIILNVLMSEGQKDSPFKPEKRDYPVDFGCPVKDNYVFVYDIPEGYTIESVPESVNLSLPDQAGFFRFQISTTGNKITVNSILSISQITFIPSEYKALHEFYALIVEKHAQQIVLKKTSL